MFGPILKALKALVSKVPWGKVASFLKWAGNLAAAAAKYSYTSGKKILAYIQKHPGKIIDWFLKGYSVYDVIKMILG
ncbi:AMEP412 family response elicitor [Bacillus velezensis]|uniref:AMEP412 family response elicitor n=1 Tax=Bacillus velezensis TaxID=492670 RepID=UPI003F7B9F9C